MTVDIRVGDALSVLATLPDASVHCVVTSPPYWGLRAYGGDPGMIGLEETLDEHLDNLVAVFREVRRVIRPDGTLWLNYGDAYTSGNRATYRSAASENKGHRVQDDQPRPRTPDGLKPKDLMMMPSLVALALRADGWWLRSMIPQIKSNPMPESATDRPTNAVEYWFLLTKAARYFYDAEAVKEPVSGTANARVAKSFKTPDGWDAGPGSHGTIHRKGREKGRTPKDVDGRSARLGRAPGWREGRAPGVTPKSAPPGSGIRQNESYQAAMIDQPATRNMRNYIFAATAPFKGAHFATFAAHVIEPWIQAGTSEAGACPDCGAPWERLLNVHYRKNRPSAGNDPRSRSEDRQAKGSMGGHHGWRGNNLLRESQTAGFRPTCACYDERYRAEHPEPRRTRKRQQRAAWGGRWKRVRARAGNPDWPVAPAVVLDPFGGAGTVGLVAERLGRDSILIEINPDYAEMARKRIEADVPPSSTKRPTGPVCDPEDLPLFAPTKAA